MEKTAAEDFAFRIKAPPGTRLGVLGVDKSVYLLRNENRLTEDHVSKVLYVVDIIWNGDSINSTAFN